MEADRALIASSDYAGLKFSIDHARSRCLLDGEIVYGSQSGIQTSVSVRVVFPDRYPRDEPRAYDPANRFIHNAHGHFIEDRESDGRCCLWLDWDSGWSPSDAGALVAFLDQVALFFHRQLIFEAGGRKEWPGPARGHGERGYYDFLIERLGVDDEGLRPFLPRLEQYGSFPRHGTCPCGSGLAYRDCHLERVAAIVRAVGPANLEWRLARWRREGYPELSATALTPRESSSFTGKNSK